MADEEEKKVNEKLNEAEPGMTYSPPQLTLQEKPIPNPNLDLDTKKKK